ncbi:uncharacterized protein K444DRAFT_536538 [Hyaloscypha bicolor E]|uniref:Fungal N-terminal domain-containing protein n=1 Tax=Hyaloscypha bicolor E TaxID=1095630 RepID=A0A2J6SZA9_9HELO|nr:uncharacterized protein K444DRAFT_536538 [Hyaloscypha bicolor E]PMD56106.1 hypothetical protein K444DRAFT_536538 [Hyaloscypha bicolor E]
MEAIAAGSAVVAFISLAGQITQGCLYIRTLLVDASEAAEDIRHLGTESLVDLDDAGIPEGQTNSVQLALDYSDEAVTGLVKLIAKNKKLGGRWGQVKFAFAKEKCAKYISRLERAKGYISTAQAGILL